MAGYLHPVLSGLNCGHIFINNGRRSYLVCIVHAYLYLLIYCVGVYTYVYLCVLICVYYSNCIAIMSNSCDRTDTLCVWLYR